MTFTKRQSRFRRKMLKRFFNHDEPIRARFDNLYQPVEHPDWRERTVHKTYPRLVPTRPMLRYPHKGPQWADYRYHGDYHDLIPEFEPYATEGV